MSKIKQNPPSGDLKPAPLMLRFRRRVRECLHWFEVVIAFGAIAIVIAGSVQLVCLMTDIEHPKGMSEFFVSYEELLSALLLLIVGVELAIMLILRRPENLLEIMFFVIARKVLIKTEHVYELLIAVIAIGVLFAIRKYLLVNDSKPPAAEDPQ
jgi:hypothetical protein